MTSFAQRWAASYRARLIVGYAVIVTLIAAGWAWSLYSPLTSAVIEQQQAHLQSVAQAGRVAIAPVTGSLMLPVRDIVAGTPLRMTVIAADGSVLADSIENPTTMSSHSDRPEVRAALAGNVGHDVRLSATQGIRQMYVAVPGTYRDEKVVLRVSEPLSTIQELSSTARGTGLLLLVATVALALIVAARAVADTARPVERLADAACAMADGDLSAAIPIERGALQPLSSALAQLRGQMRARIEDLESEQRDLRSVLDGLDDSVLLLENREVRIVNRAATVMFRTTAAAMRNKDVGQTPLPASLLAVIEQALGSGQSTMVDVGPDPLQKYSRVAIVPLGASGGRTRHLVVVTDITDRMRLDRMRRDFVANASHELKTPTTSILLLAESAGTAAGDGDADQALAFLGAIQDEAARLRHIVLELLDLSRLETTTPAGTITDVRQALDLSLAAHRRAANQKGLALSADLGAITGEDLYARVDATDIAIALDNLLSNAISYTESGSVTVRLRADEDAAVIEVADTGIGIPAEDIPRVFERFYRVDRARSRDSGGTGLGLALMRHVVERSGGTVNLESASGIGTTVTVRLPRAR